jgi:hypothetical protein
MPKFLMQPVFFYNTHRIVLGLIRKTDLYKLIFKKWHFSIMNKGKVKSSLYRVWRPLGLRGVEAPTFSDIWLTDGGKVVSLTPQPLFTPRKIPGPHFCLRLSGPQGHSAAGRNR